MHSANYKKAEILYQNNQYSMQDIFSLIFVSRFIERAAAHTYCRKCDLLFTGNILHRNNEII